jgi:hypothetical protein
MQKVLCLSPPGEVAALVAPGNLLVSSRESSRGNLELMAKHPEVAGRLAIAADGRRLPFDTAIGCHSR